MTRNELIEAARHGDHEAFEALAIAVSPRLHALARLILRDTYLAEDAVQEALVHMWRSLPTLRDPGSFDGWAYRLITNACADAGTTDAYPLVFADRGVCGGGDMPGEPSPDGRHLVVTRTRCGSGPVPDRNQRAALFIVDTDGTNLRQITPYGIPWSHDQGIARWSPDGTRILFAGANFDLFTIRPDGSDQHKIRLAVDGDKEFLLAPDWSPDGTRIVFNLFLREGLPGIYTAAPDGSDVTLVLAYDPLFGDYPTWGKADY